jgi:hypothetical protein
VVLIGKPIGGSHFNTTDGDTNGLVIFDQELTDMIVPDMTFANDPVYRAIYGDQSEGKRLGTWQCS